MENFENLDLAGLKVDMGSGSNALKARVDLVIESINQNLAAIGDYLFAQL